jgi:hypothetical protein
MAQKAKVWIIYRVKQHGLIFTANAGIKSVMALATVTLWTRYACWTLGT